MSHLSEELINTYLDQTLDKSTQQKVETHLSGCEQCRAEVNGLQILFSTLDELPDIPLTRDLTPSILARLPKVAPIPALWRQPAFLLQSLLTMILLAVSMPMLLVLAQQAMIWRDEILLPTLQLPTLAETFAKLTPILDWEFGSAFTFTLPELTFSMPTLPTLPVSPDANLMPTLMLLVGILWIAGIFFLLRSKPEVKK